jgi:hypothetical protein
MESEYSNKIIHCLYIHNELDLALQFIKANESVVELESDAEIRLQILLKISLSEAFFFQVCKYSSFIIFFLLFYIVSSESNPHSTDCFYTC